MESTRQRLQAAAFYGILDTGYATEANWDETCAQLANGGAKIIQVRAKTETVEQREALLIRSIDTLTRIEPEHRPILIVNDDLELAARYPSVGLHIGQDDTPPQVAREHLGPDRILGLSTHSIEQATAAMNLPAGTIDYFAVGPVFATQTKPDYIPVGLELVRQVAAQSPQIPFFCIGGINRSNIHQVIDAGGTRFVTVSDVLLANPVESAVREILEIIEGS